jgi:hypothetical protein
MRTGGTASTVSNCILWDNDMSGDEIQVDNATPTYSCIYDPNTASSIPDGNGNITADPMFAYPDPDLNNYHLDPNSPCKDQGASGSYTGEKDIDNQDRVYNGTVDMGADEITCDQVFHEQDWSGNGIINMEEFALFSAAWLSEDPNSYAPPKDPNDEYIWYEIGLGPLADIDDDLDVDLDDFALFCENWLWQACYKASQEGTLMMIESRGGYDGRVARSAMLAELSIDSFKTTQLTKARQLSVEKAEKMANEPTLEEQLVNMQDMIDFLENLWLEDAEVREQIDEQQWEKFMKAIYEWFDVLENQYDSKTSVESAP